MIINNNWQYKRKDKIKLLKIRVKLQLMLAYLLVYQKMTQKIQNYNNQINNYLNNLNKREKLWDKVPLASNNLIREYKVENLIV